MELIRNILAAFSGIMGLMLLIAVFLSKFRHISYIVAAASYLLASYFSFEYCSWYPLVSGWILVFIIRAIYGDSIKF
jgi:hypothetical protein